MERIENAKSTLKVLGILTIIFAVFEILAGLGTTVLGGAMGSLVGTVPAEEAAEAATATGLFMLLGILALVEGVIYLLLGIFSVRASNDFSKIGPAYVFSVICLALSIITLILSLFDAPTVTDIITGIVGIVFAGCVFWAAKTIKEAA